ncbi:helix-turn-helix domain-containing protein [Yoonia sp. R2331]|uniref:helix-turn-helix domain-containing protein n=1 Tax=Yoonia sp. R2331 TaxID=3237238 RepID=UPI0034E57D9B
MPPFAFTLNQDFPPTPRTAFQIGRHYLLYARAGTMRLEHNGLSWSLPPARAALIAADTPIWISMRHTLSACSALFDPAKVPTPPQPLAVFEMTPLARELVLACGDWGEDTLNRPAMADQLFDTLQTVCWSLSATPFPGMVPLGRSAHLTRAIAWTEENLADDLTFADAAAVAGLSERSLARRFAEELGQPWGQVLRQMRMIRAHEELTMTDQSVTQIALAVGYQSLSAFHAAFRGHFGKSPSACRGSS